MLCTRNKRKLTAAVFFICTIPASLSYAQPGDRGRPQGPPPEAIEACAELEEDDVCSFSGRRGEAVQGSCIVPQQKEATLACAPTGGRPPSPENAE